MAASKPLLKVPSAVTMTSLLPHTGTAGAMLRHAPVRHVARASLFPAAPRVAPFGGNSVSAAAAVVPFVPPFAVRVKVPPGA